jgi:hypothetical protein
MDALDLLDQQLRRIGEALNELREERSPGQRTSLVAGLARQIRAHTCAEERALYAACWAQMEPDDADRRAICDAYEANALLRFAAEALVQTRVTDVRFAPRLRTLERAFAHHASCDEDAVFPKAKRIFTDEILDQVGLAIERSFAALLATSIPSRVRVARRGPAGARSVGRTGRRAPTAAGWGRERSSRVKLPT